MVSPRLTNWRTKSKKNKPLKKEDLKLEDKYVSQKKSLPTVALIFFLLNPNFRYKDKKVIPLSDWQDVEVVMKEEEGHIVSTLTIHNLSRDR